VLCGNRSPEKGRRGMEEVPSAKTKRGSPPIPPNYVSLRQLQELRLKEEEQEKRQRQEAAAAVEAKREAARKAEIEAMAAAAWRPETKVIAAVSVPPVRAKERRDGGRGTQWVAVAHRRVVPPSAVPEAVPVGLGHRKKGLADAPHGGGKPEGKAKGQGKEKEKVSAVTSAQIRTADEPDKPAEASSRGGRPENKGEGKGKAEAKEESLGDKSTERVSTGGSEESAGASSRRSKNPKRKKGAGGRSARAEASAARAPAKTAGASPRQGVKPEKARKPKSPGRSRTDASPISDSSHGRKAGATTAPPASPAAGIVGEPRFNAETKPEGLVEGHRRRPVVEAKGAAEHKPRVVSRQARPRRPGDRCHGAGEQEHGRVWVPKAATESGRLR
jgi:hypothetical protein